MRPRSRARRALRLPRLILSRSLIQLAASLLETHGRVRSQKPPRTTAQPLPEPARSQKPPRTIQPLPSQKRPLNRFGNVLACLVSGVSSGVSSATVTSVWRQELARWRLQHRVDSRRRKHRRSHCLFVSTSLSRLVSLQRSKGEGSAAALQFLMPSAGLCVVRLQIRLQTSPSRVNQLIQENRSPECPKRPTASSLL